MTENMKILIAYDGSDSADSALDDLSRAGFPDGGVEAKVVTVAEVWLPPMDDGETVHRHFASPALKQRYDMNVEMLKEADGQASAAAERVRTLFPGWKVTSDSTYGSPAWEVLAFAEEMTADLIVLGAKGMSAVERVLLGSVSQKVMTEAKCPVRVSRGKVIVEESPVRLLIGYDGTEGAREAVRTVALRDWPDNTEVKVVIVEDSMFVRSSLEIDVDDIKSVGEGLVDDLRKIPMNAELTVLEGNPKNEIVSLAGEWDADCIFIGATRYNDILTKYFIGSVSSAIVSRAHCTVEVVRPRGYGSGKD
ncbi:MAG: universal stress protein [Acidobacteriota bacterium]|nr:MAG: universal stress protein [Acidobacteriota bacterium]